MKVELVADYACQTGEGPLWHPDEEQLYWVDIPRGRLFCLDPAADAHSEVFSGPVIGGFTIQENGWLLLFLEKGGLALWHRGRFQQLLEEHPEEKHTRFNDVIADPEGRVFCGTMSTSDRPGRLYRLDPDGRFHCLLEGLGTPNGMGFTPGRSGFYFTDTRQRTIFIFDYDQATGNISNKRTFIKTGDQEGRPDGMTVDAEGYVWSAQWDGGCIVRYKPDGTEVTRIEFPARKVSCVTFAGDDLSELYVTTAGGQNKETEGTGAGALFRLKPGVKGVPEFRSRIDPAAFR